MQLQLFPCHGRGGFRTCDEQAGDPVPFFRVWVRVLCAAGLRIDEAYRARRCDFDLIANCLHVGHAKTQQACAPCS